MSKVIPDYNPKDRNHKFIWDMLAHEMTKEDFEAIQSVLTEREKDHEAINKTTVTFREFGYKETPMMQPCPVREEQKEQAHTYVDWSSAMDIWLILSKYADLYSKK